METMATTEPAEIKPAGGPAIFHLADVRLGGAFPFLGNAGSAHRLQVRDTFVRAVDQGLELAPALVLITGNLFGTPFPPRDLAEFACAQLERFSKRGIPVLIAAGPLDACYEKVYAQGAFSDLERVVVFPETPKAVELRDLDLTVVGVSCGAAPVQVEALAAVAAHKHRRCLVGALHMQIPESEEGLRALHRQIAASGAGYLALGGSPVRRNLSAEAVTAWCPGAPEMVVAEEGEGAPLFVRFGDGITKEPAHPAQPGPLVQPVPVAQRRFIRHVFDPAAFNSTEELADAIRALADPNHAAVIQMCGASRINQFIDVDDLRNRLSCGFLSLEIVDDSLPSPADLEAAAYPELSVAGRFVGVARAEMARASDPEAIRRAGAALRLGLWLLEGRRPS